MEYTIEVLVDGKVEYTHDAKINIDKGVTQYLLDDFWKGNAGHDSKGSSTMKSKLHQMAVRIP